MNTESRDERQRRLETAIFPDTGRIVPELGEQFIVTGVTKDVLDFHDGKCTVVEFSPLPDTATRMRDACVAKVKAMRDEWQQRHDGLTTDADLIDRLCLEGDMRVANGIIAAISSLTLDQVEKKQ